MALRFPVQKEVEVVNITFLCTFHEKGTRKGSFTATVVVVPASEHFYENIGLIIVDLYKKQVPIISSLNGVVMANDPFSDLRFSFF